MYILLYCNISIYYGVVPCIYITVLYHVYILMHCAYVYITVLCMCIYYCTVHACMLLYYTIFYMYIYYYICTCVCMIYCAYITELPICIYFLCIRAWYILLQIDSALMPNFHVYGGKPFTFSHYSVFQSFHRLAV